MRSRSPGIPARRIGGGRWKGRQAGRLLTAALTTLWLASAPGNPATGNGAEKDTAEPFVAVRTDRTGDIGAPAVDRVMAELGGDGPQHVVVLIHGWDTPLFESHKQYDRIARDVGAEFAARGLRVGVIGLQWPSDAGPQRSWVPKAFVRGFVGLLGFPHALADPYAGKVPLARAAGRQGLRRLLFAARERFPEARRHLFAHSMGAEMAIHAIHPRAAALRGKSAIFKPEGMLQVDVLALAGADLDDTAALDWSAPGAADEWARPRLWWITVPNPDQKGDRDRVLVLRKLARGRRAVGNAGPRLRADQMDRVLQARGLVFDTDGIPRNHDIVDYYSRERLASLAGAAAELQQPAGHTSPLLETLGRVLAAPDEPSALRPYLETGVPTVTLYALWRLERQFCGDSRHLENGYLLKVAQVARAHPERLERERATASCSLVRARIWPVSAAGPPEPAGSRQ